MQNEESLSGIVICYSNVSNNIHDNSNGTDNCTNDTNTNANSHRMEEKHNTIDEFKHLRNNINIFRYKFTDEFTNELYKFSKIHQYDHRKVFKEAWEEWLEENDNIVSSEVRRLTSLGYEGDILEKMFKSARYYFRKKSTEKKAPAERNSYQGVQKQMLVAIDNHIKCSIDLDNFKPSDGFNEFCNNNIELLKEEIAFLCQNGLNDPNVIRTKIKKTYKNRYFLLVK